MILEAKLLRGLGKKSDFVCHRRLAVRCPTACVFKKAEIRCSAENNVIQKLDPQDCSRGLELRSDVEVALGRVKLAAGMVMGDDYAGSAV